MVRFVRIILFAFLVLPAAIASAQEAPGEPTSATDHRIRIHRAKRPNAEASRETERHGKSLRKRKASGSAGSARESKVYRKHRHFADREIKYKSRSRLARKEALGVSTE